MRKISLSRQFSALEAIAFITGAALMVYELTASRLLAPTIGSSTYVWTSVIGVIIAALSIGYTIGGRIADKRVMVMDIPILLLGTVGCMANTLLFAPQVLASIAGTGFDPRAQGLLASLILFMPASLILGVISPYLVRLHTASLSTAGRSVASLSALNAVGGIIGTFCAGFIFFSYMGVNLTLLLLCLALLATSWLISPKSMLQFRLLCSVVLLCLLGLAYIPKVDAAIHVVDTPSAHYRIIDATKDGRDVRYLATGPGGAQSGIFIDDPDELLFAYTKKMAAVTAETPRKASILVLGGGTLTQPQYLAKTYPQATIDVVDIDPDLTTIARDYFGYTDPTHVNVITNDARAFLNQNKKRYDIIYVDVYSNTSIPFSVATKEYTARLRQALTPKGVVIANIIAGLSPHCAPLLQALQSTYGNSFAYSAYLPTEDPQLAARQNIIAVYSNAQLDWLSLSTATRTPANGLLLRDDFAPLEKLTQACSNSH